MSKVGRQIKTLRSYRRKKREVIRMIEELKAFESQKWPGGVPPVVHLIETRCQQLGIDGRTLENFFGDGSTCSKILSGERNVPRKRLMDLADFLKVDVEEILTAEEGVADV